MGESVSSIRTDRINVNSNGINDSVKNSNEAANNSEVKKLDSEEISIDIDVDDSNEDVYELMALDESEVENMKNRVSMFSKYIDGANEYKNLIDSIYENLNFKDKLRFKATNGNWLDKILNLVINGFIKDDIVVYDGLSDEIPKITIKGDTLIITADDGCIYTFEDGYCISKKFQNGIEFIISYGPNGELYDINYNFDIYSEIMESTNQFGGNQAALNINYSQFINDPIIISLMQKYFPDASALDYRMYFGVFNNVGCGYTAFVNTIFEYFQGRENEFESIFGFPMFSIDENLNIDYNYEYLILDLFNYIWGNQGYTIQELYGGEYLNGIFIGRDDENQIVDGSYFPLISDGTFTVVEDDSILKSSSAYNFSTWLSSYGIETDIEILNIRTKEIEPNTSEWQKEKKQKEKEIRENYKKRGIKSDFKYDSSAIIFRDYTIEEKKSIISNILNDNKSLIICGENIELNGINVDDVLVQEGHGMSIVDVCESGVVVSSWGNKYILSFSDADKCDIYVINHE